MNEYQPPFTISPEMLATVSSIMEKIGSMSSFSHLNRMPHLRKQNRIRSVYSSCAIEANSLSMDQVGDLINGKQVVGPQKDILEVQNAIEAYDLLDSLDPFSINDLKKVHGVLGKNVILDAGNFRKGNEGVTDAKGRVVFVAPPPEMVVPLMNNLFSWVKTHFATINPLILSSIFHYEFVFIHPFGDGNGRTARLWQTLLLRQWKPFFTWLPIENPIETHQEEYYKAIRQSHRNGNADVFILFMLSMIDQTLSEAMSQIDVRVSSLPVYVQKLLSIMPKGHYMTSNEILVNLGLKSKETLRKHYLNPAIEKGLIKLEFPEKPTSKNQRYIKA